MLLIANTELAQLSKVLFTTPIQQEEELQTVLQKHGATIAVTCRSFGAMQWRLRSEMDLDDLCNVLHDIGYQGINLTAFADLRDWVTYPASEK